MRGAVCYLGRLLTGASQTFPAFVT